MQRCHLDVGLDKPLFLLADPSVIEEVLVSIDRTVKSTTLHEQALLLINRKLLPFT